MQALTQGKSSKDFVAELGYPGAEEIVHRDNICLLSQRRFQANFSEPNLEEHERAEGQEGAAICLASTMCTARFSRLLAHASTDHQLLEGPSSKTRNLSEGTSGSLCLSFCTKIDMLSMTLCSWNRARKERDGQPGEALYAACIHRSICGHCSCGGAGCQGRRRRQLWAGA